MKKVFFLFIFFCLVFIFSLKVGAVSISWREIFQTFFNSYRDENSVILLQLRLPRVLAATLIGASLGAVGLVFQTLLRNPLAEPYTLGLSGGSALGAVIALNLSLSPILFWVPCFSTLGCFAATFLVLVLSHRTLEFESRSLILFGVMISLFFGALVVTGLSILSPPKLQSALFWLLGEFGTTRDPWIYTLGPVLFLGLIYLYLKSKTLDALGLGESRALSLGYSPKKERSIFIFICTILTAFGVSIVGLVGFVGLVSPHVARLFLKTSRHKDLLLGSSFLGGSFLIMADALGRSVAGTVEIPAGSVAALFGAPVLIFLLVRQKHAAHD